MLFIQMSINVYFCHDFVFVSIKTLRIINIFFFMKSGVLSSFLFIWVGFCPMGFGLSGVIPNGVLSIYRDIMAYTISKVHWWRHSNNLEYKERRPTDK